MIEGNGFGGISFGGRDFLGWSMDVLGNGASHPFSAGIGMQAPLANVILEDSTFSANLGMGLHASSAEITDAEFIDQTLDGIKVCPGPVLLDRVKLLGNKGSGLIVCDAAGGADSVIRNLEVRNNLVDGIRNESLSSMDISGTLFDGNGRFGVNNLASLINVRAIGNNWGHPSGPSGVGPGQGDAVSKNVIYEDPIDTSPLEIIIGEIPASIPRGEQTSIPVTLRHGTHNEEISLRVTDSQGWLQFDASGLVSLQLEDGVVVTQL